MKCLYYCTTPFQLLTALNMQFNHIIPSEAENEKADIIVANIFKNAEDISRRIKNTKLFNNVYLINEEDHKIIRMDLARLLLLQGIRCFLEDS